MTLTEEVSSDVIDGRPARKFVLKISYVIESEIGSHKVRLHETDTVLLSVANMSCAPEATAQPHPLRVGIREVAEAVAVKLASVEGLIVRKVASHTARYEGGRPRTSRVTSEVIEPRCEDVDAAMFRVPEGYRHQEPILAMPGR
ncbi:MAG TPA: hypothetical protein VHL59_03690 [Thermoanaerobaculia bacterium]|nr:hypothetical protein [Thermoanaerobaculia bacterium]